MLTFSHPRSWIQGSKRHPIPDPGSATLDLLLLLTLDCYLFKFLPLLGDLLLLLTQLLLEKRDLCVLLLEGLNLLLQL